MYKVRIDQEAALERLLDLMEASGCAGIDQWQAERKQALADREARSKQAVLDSVVYINRVEVKQQRYAGDKLLDVIVPVERFVIRRGDLLAFSTKYGLSYNDLLAVVELRRQEVRGKGGQVFRSGSGQYIDTSARDRERKEEIEQNQRELVELTARNQKVAATPFSYPVPQAQEWR
jgi:hypothetical protein